jgi:hypothetical protein
MPKAPDWNEPDALNQEWAKRRLWTDGRGNYSPVETLTCNQRTPEWKPIDEAQCRECKKSGPAVDEFTSPHTGLCTECSAKRLGVNEFPGWQEMRAALEQIARWDGFPRSGMFWESGHEMSYGAAYGSNGEREFMRNVAHTALAKARGEKPDAR